MRLGHRFNNTLLQSLLTFIKRLPDKEGSHLIILGTTSNEHICQDLGLWDCFNLKIGMHPLEASNKEIQLALSHYLKNSQEEINSMKLDKKFKLPIKELNFIGESLALKRKTEGPIDVNQEFLDLYAQIRGVGN